MAPLIDKIDLQNMQKEQTARKTAVSHEQKLSEYMAQPPDLVRDFEHLEHTADVQLHSWGASLEDAASQLIISMFGYITDLGKVNIKECRAISVQGMPRYDCTWIAVLATVSS